MLCDAREVVCSLGVLAARVVQHAQLVEYGGLVRRDGVRLFDVVHRERQVVEREGERERERERDHENKYPAAPEATLY